MVEGNVGHVVLRIAGQPLLGRGSVVEHQTVGGGNVDRHGEVFPVKGHALYGGVFHVNRRAPRRQNLVFLHRRRGVDGVANFATNTKLQHGHFHRSLGGDIGDFRTRTGQLLNPFVCFIRHGYGCALQVGDLKHTVKGVNKNHRRGTLAQQQVLRL